jgi:hypothetical protein
MAELKALSQDVLKNDSDIANYNAEFKNLQVQLYQMSETKFNGVSLFASTFMTAAGVQTNATFNTSGSGNTVSIFTSATGESGSKVSINKTALLAALTITAATPNTANTFQSANGTAIYSFASETSGAAFAKCCIGSCLYAGSSKCGYP